MKHRSAHPVTEFDHQFQVGLEFMTAEPVNLTPDFGTGGEITFVDAQTQAAIELVTGAGTGVQFSGHVMPRVRNK